MKKIASLLLCVVLVIGMIPSFTITASAAKSGYYTYTVTNGEATITDCSTSLSGNITIPSTLGGYPVTSIGQDAFRNCTSLTSVTIPDSVTSIGMYTFLSCTSLTSVTIPDSVTSIGGYAFHYCTSLTSVTIGDRVTGIGNKAFYNCHSLISVTIPNSVTSIGSYAFYNCISLTSVTIPNSVTSIGDEAFSNCSKLTSVTIPDSVTSIGDEAFRFCDSSLVVGCSENSYAHIYCKNNSIKYCSMHTHKIALISPTCTAQGYTMHTCSACGNAYETDTVAAKGHLYTSVVTPPTCTAQGYTTYTCSVCNHSYKSNTIAAKGHSYTSAVTPPTFESQGYTTYICSVCDYSYSSNYVSNETDVSDFDYTVSGGKVTITAYNGNDAEVVVPAKINGYTVTSIGDGVFANNITLKKIKLPSGVTSLGADAFSFCEALEYIELPSTLTSIGDFAFYQCSALTDISLPAALNTIGVEVFANCTSLLSFSVNTNNNYYTAENGILFNKTKTELICYPSAKQRVAYLVPNTVITIADGAFVNCGALKTLTLLDTVTSIGDNAIIDNADLTVKCIANSYAHTFCEENAIKFELLSSDYSNYEWQIVGDEVTITKYKGTDTTVHVLSEIYGYPVTAIDEKAFYLNRKITSVTIPGTVKTIGSNAFRGCSALTEVVFNEGLETISTYAFGGTKLQKVVCPDTLKTIGVSAFNGVTTLGDVDFKNVQSIKGTAFAGCTNLGTTAAGTRIVIPATVKEVAAGAFQNCTGFTRIDWYPVRLTSGAAGNKTNPAFQGCTGLKTVRIYQTAEYVPSYLFYKTGQITSISFYGEPIVKEIGDYAFFQARIGTVTFPASLQKIGRESFRNCNLLKIVNFGTGVQSIGQLAFSFSNNLETVTIPGNVKTIYAYAFRGCSKLKTVVLEEGVDYISSYAFMSTALESITLPASLTKINSGLTYGTSAEIHYYEGTYVDQYLHSVAAKIKNETLVPIV